MRFLASETHFKLDGNTKVVGMMARYYVTQVSIFYWGLSCLAVWFCLPWVAIGRAQELYQLTAPELRASSQAERNDQLLVIRDGEGNVTAYERDGRFDTRDGAWLGYFNPAIRQAIHWPNAGQRHMEIGTFDPGGSVRFRQSRMRIEAMAANVPRPNSSVLPGEFDVPRGDPNDRLDFQQPTLLRLAHQSGQQQFLGQLDDGSLAILGNANNLPMDWMMVPISPGIVRLQMQQERRWAALSCGPAGRSIAMTPLGNHAYQLWRWQSCPGVNGGYLLESVLYPGQVLAFHQGQLALQPMGFFPQQQWYPLLPIVPQLPQPTYRSLSTRTNANPPLPAATVELRNRSEETLLVLLADRRPDGMSQTIRIPAGATMDVQLDRDAGGTITELHEVIGPSGDWIQEEQVIAIPPATFYDVSVYEEFLQSIAIDRTGKSPNPIEDVNYQPKSVGWFEIPAGARLPERAAIDVLKNAKAAGNPGAVRRLSADLLQQKKGAMEDPLKAILREFQGQRAAF